MKEAILIADPKTPAWDFAKKIYDYIEKNREDGFSLFPIEMTTFNNKEILPYIAENIRQKDVYLIQSSNKHPNDWWVELLLLKDLCLSASVRSLSFVLPNMLYSRQDRKTKSRVPISARALAKSLSSPKIARIITMDLHSPQIQGFYDESIPIDNLQSFPQAVKYIRENHSDCLENLVIASPDSGGVDRAMAFLKRMINADALEKVNHHYDFAFTHKLRIVPGEVEKMWFVGDVKGKNVLLIDDMYDTCGTTNKSGDKFLENGANKILTYATFGLYTKGTKDVLEKFDSVMTSNAHYSPKEGDGNIEIIDVAPLFGEAIYRAQKGISISELFD